MKSYSYILFDWDGTIARTLDVWLKALKTSLEQQGYSLSDKQIGANYTLFKERSKSLGVSNVSEILEEADHLLPELTKNTRLYDGVPNTLSLLHAKNKKIALVTTSTHTQIDPLIKKYQLSPYLDAIVCGDDIRALKPDPEALHKALVFLSGNSNDAVMIGDSGTDIIAAKNAGIDSILFYPHEHSIFYDIARLKKLHPTHIVHDLQAIIGLV